jgi:hypothetical protein
MNPYRNALRVITRRYLDDFQYGEELFETEDGPIPDESDDSEQERSELNCDGEEIELKEAA